MLEFDVSLLQIQVFLAVEERPVGLTEAGELLYSRWRPLLAAFEQSVQVLERFRTTGASRLRVCTVDSLNVLNDMPEVRNALLRRQPEADLSFEYASFSQWRSKLLRDEVDVVRRGGGGDGAGAGRNLHLSQAGMYAALQSACPEGAGNL